MIEIEEIGSMASTSRDIWENRLALPYFMQYKPLKTVEESGINNIKPIYLRFYNDIDVGRANLYIVDTDLSTFDSKLKVVRKTIKKWYPDFLNLRTLECGFFNSIGEGLSLSDDSNYRTVLGLLAEEMESLAVKNNCTFQMIRDIPLKRYRLYKSVLRKYGFYPTSGFPDTEISLPFSSLDEYLLCFQKHKRKNIQHILKELSEQSAISYEFTNEYVGMVGTFAELWKNVSDSSESYQREKLDEKYFKKVAENQDKESEALVFKKDGKIIAFFLAMFDDECYFLENYGADYSAFDRDDLNIYKAGILMCIERAIKRGKKRMSLGITTYFPKLTLGAEIVPLVYFVKYTGNNEYSKALAKMFYDDIKMPDLSKHHPFKTSSINRINLQKLTMHIRKDQYDLPDNDIFLKVSKYHRMTTMRLAKIYNLYPEFRSAQESSVRMQNKEHVVLLGTNSYLGAANLPSVKEAAKAAIDKYGSGCSGSPLLNGTLDIHNELEASLARFFGREAVMLCSTGFQTNLAGITALADSKDTLILDERSHRSLFDGARLSGANYYIYKHNDMKHLEWVLSKLKDRRKLVITDSVFSMEGVMADMKRICDLAQAYNARLFIDESHAVGVFGEKGRGICELLGVEDRVDIIMGTFSKSFASIGGFLAGKKDVIEFIKAVASPHIFSASLPPASIATVMAVLQIIEGQPDLRKDILSKAEYMANSLAELGYNARFKGTQIVPVIFGNETLAMAAYKHFMEEGVYVNPILPPAVPESESGFRTSYIANHRWEDLEFALDVFKRNRKAFSVT